MHFRIMKEQKDTLKKNLLGLLVQDPVQYILLLQKTGSIPILFLTSGELALPSLSHDGHAVTALNGSDCLLP